MVTGQTPVASFTFDGCSLTDNLGNFNNNFEFGAPICDCGPSGDAYYLDGASDYMVLDTTLKDLLLNDFTLSFYFWAEDTGLNYNLFSIKKPDCIDTDSTMHVRYISATQQVELDLTENAADRIVSVQDVDPDRCWHHIVLTKEGTNYAFYVDEQFTGATDIGSVFEMAPEAEVAIGKTECLGIGEQLMNGRIDEIVFYDRVLNVDEIEALSIFPDQIITDDTTIFSGESVQVNTGGTCAPNFSWSNPGDLDNPNSFDPIITPPQSTTYTFTADHGTCIVEDTIRINVVDSELLDCADLLLPKAFTPNGDGLNDFYGISNDFIVDELVYFEIFDRWGTRVFETANVGQKWDGNFKSSPLTPANYVYKIKYVCRSTEFVKTGNFSILR